MPTHKAKDKSIYLERRLVEQFMFGSGRARRFTQDSPVLPDVWLEYAIDPTKKEEPTTRFDKDDPDAVDLLLTPFRDAKTGEVAGELRKRLPKGRRVVYNQSTVLARLEFEDLVQSVIPMTDWWARLLERFDITRVGKVLKHIAENVKDPEHPQAYTDQGQKIVMPPDVLWMIRIVGAIRLARQGKLPRNFVKKDGGPAKATTSDWLAIVRGVAELMRGMKESPEPQHRIFSISLNRLARSTVSGSALAVKADAARQLFSVSCKDIRWAILDSGIDATHPAFRRKKRKKGSEEPPEVPEAVDATPFEEYESRIRESYDFSNIQKILDADSDELPAHLEKLVKRDKTRAKELRKEIAAAKEALGNGHSIDWGLFAPILRIPHDEHYIADGHVPTAPLDHGTHVAGILGADWKKTATNDLRDSIIGVCPDIEMFDIRILDAKGNGDEFTVMAALQFVRFLNARNDYMAVHGVNMSLSIPHDVANYACGRTPVCDEAERTVSAGMVVVVAAGNQGYRTYTTPDGISASAYNTISITDPGNAEMVITVGATHRARPHTYGVSYFSSRGPTGDGRLKPDLVAPGEKITAPLPGAMSGLKDGTSMAAPHVSGAAAMLMARHNELVGRPMRIKEILCKTATDLGRERYFQGAGMLDILRAMQSV